MPAARKQASIWTRARAAFRVLRNDVGTALTRAYKIAQFDRLNANWPTTSISINRELRQSLRYMRDRIRILAQNDDYIKRYLSLEMNNIVGWEGFTLQLSMSDWDAGSVEPVPARDAQILREVKAAWAEWCHKENCSASGKMSHVDQTRLAVRSVKRDGEVLIRRVVGDNPFAFTLKFIDVAWLDEFYNEQLPNGNRVIMSVEVDRNDRPVAYWLTQPPSEYMFSGRPTGAPFRERVDAKDFIHFFYVLDDDTQVRGVPQPHTAALTLKVLDDYEYAELVGVYAEQCQLPYLVPPADTDEADLTVTSPEGIPQPIERQVEPAIQTILPPGWDVKSFTPTHPARDGGEFTKKMLRRAAAGLEKAYYSLANDLSEANYSSLKAGQQEERAGYRYDQRFFIEHFERVVFGGPGLCFLNQAWLAGKITCSPSDLKRIRASWRPRGWPSIEPLKEIQATILGINNFLDSHIDDAAERGEDWEEIVLKLSRAYKLIDKLGLKVLPESPQPTVKKESKEEAADDGADDGQDPANEDAPDDGTERVLPGLAHRLLPAGRSNGHSKLIL